MPDTPPNTIHVDITDTIDLHTFRPGEISNLIDDYIEACLAKGFTTVRIVHGKGRGALKRGVLAKLSRHPNVVEYHDAAAHGGGWGATEVVLKQIP
jgi:dsDNA-specific endonuclease/ATPase MutS2